jgi:hypothetical protein
MALIAALLASHGRDSGFSILETLARRCPMTSSTVESFKPFASDARQTRQVQWWERFLMALMRALAGCAT